MKRIYTMLFAICAFAFTLQAQIVLSEGFENGVPSDWTVETMATDGGWVGVDVAAAASGAWALPDHGGAGVAVTNDDACNCDKSNDVLYTPEIDLTGLTNPTLSFDRAYGAYGYQGVNELATVEVSNDGGTTWTVLETLAGIGTIAGVVGSPEWANEGYDLSAYAGETIIVAFRYSDDSGWLYGWALDNVLVFQPVDWEMELVKLDIDPIHADGATVNIQGQVKNFGANNITSFDLAWTDGTNNYSETISGVDIPSFGTYDFTATDAYTTAAGVSDEITVTISNPNGNMDGDASNNELSASVTGISFIPVKRVVVEEATGTWCGWCPRGTVALEYMTDAYPETFIGIAVHNGDPMVVSEYDSNLDVGGYPSCHVDRAVLDTDPNSDNLEAIHNDRIANVIPAGEIMQVVSYDQDTREITAEVSAEFVAPVENYMFNLVILEDSVTGTSSGFAQANFYGSNNIDLFSLDGTNWANLPDPLPASQSVYDHVARAILGGWAGQAGSLPASISAGETHSYTFTYTLPANMNEDHIHVVGMLMDTDNDDIVNAISSELPIEVSNKNLYNENLVKIFPNPFSDVSTINIELENPAEVTIEVYNTVGQMMGRQQFGQLAGEQNIPLNGSSLSEGMYFVHIIVNDQIVTKRISIAR